MSGVRWWIGASVLTAAMLGAGSLATRTQAEAPGGPALAGNRAPCELAFSPDGSRVFVTEMAEGTVAVVDAATGAVQGHWQTGGDQPAGLAVSPDDSTLAVANSYSGNVALLNAATGTRRALVSIPGMPYNVAISRDGRRAFVSVSQLDQVAVIDLPTATVKARITVGHRPRALALTPDGKTLAVANLAEGTVSVLATTPALSEQARVKLKGVNVRGLAVTSDGGEVYATLMPAFNRKPTDDAREIWHNVVQAVTLSGDASGVAEDQWMDFVRARGMDDILGSPDAYGIAVDKAGKYAWMAVGGRDVVTRITIHDRNRNAIWPLSQVEMPVGANPRGLVLSPDGKRIWVANYLGNSLTVLDAESGETVRTVQLGAASHTDPAIQGEYLFNHASMTRAQRFTCASCHPDGMSDGLTWQFVHVKDGIERRNSRDLRAGIADTAPFRWSGAEKTLEQFVHSEVTGLLGGPTPTESQTKALIDALNAFRLPPNPYRAPDGTLTAEAKRGEVLFVGKAGCGSCHGGPKHGGTGLASWVGTTPANQKLDVPHLTGVYDSAPYLHDGRAATLEEIFSKYNGAKKHGNAHLLTPAELAAVIRYVREL